MHRTTSKHSSRRRVARRAALTLVAPALVALAACGGGYTGPTGGGGGAGGQVVPPGLGVGDPCVADTECRDGLVCEAASSTCQPSHSKAAGTPCVLSAECLDGLFCAAGVCATAGSGAAGDACTSDADCESGLKCGLVGFGAQCVPEGAGDVGDACATSVDCFGGLACLGGLCAIAPPGTPPFGLPFAGIECEDESAGSPTAHFRVPRGADDADFYRLPFPNDVRFEGGALDLTGHPSPGSSLLGYDPVQRYVDALESDNDGFGVYSSVTFRFSHDVDSTTIGDAVHLVDLTTGTTLGLRWYYGPSKTAYVCPNRLAIRPSTGRPLDPGHTYAAYFTNDVRAAGGAPIARSSDLDALLADAEPGDPALVPHWPKYEPLRAYFASSAIDPSTVLNASVFTVGHPERAVSLLESSVASAPAPTASGWVLCDTGVASPCPDSTGERACGAAHPDYHELHALVSLPIFQQGTAPYLTPEDGGDLAVDGAGAPTVVRTEDVCLSLTVPKGPAPAGGWPTVIFAHGTGGHFRSHVLAELGADFGAGVDDGAGTVVRAAVLGIDQVQHGPRRNGSSASPNDLFFNFANPKAARGNARQGAADQLSLLRFVPTVSFDAASSPTGEAFSLGAVAAWGHSQGATELGLVLPYGAFAGAVLSGEGASLLDALLTKTSPVDIASVLPLVLGDVDSTGKLVGGQHHPVLGLLQTYIDPADPLLYAKSIASTPATAPRHVFQPYGLDDTYTPSDVQRTFALAARLGMAEHDASVGAPDEIGSLTPIPLPVTGNLTVMGQPVTAVLRQYAPAASSDGHFVAFEVPTARADSLRFLAGALSGIVPRVGP